MLHRIDRSGPRRSTLALLVVVTLGVIALASGFLVACMDRGGDRPRGDRRLELWTLALKGRPELERYVQDQVAAFERANPGVRVTWVDVPFAQLDRKLMAAAAAGRAPDVVNFSDRTYARFVALGALIDLHGLLPGDPDEVYLPGVLALGRMGGRLLALPWYLTTQAVLAHEGLLARAGMTGASLPRTWAELRTAAREYRRAVGDDGTYLFSVPLGHESDLLMMLMSDGLMPLRPGSDGRLVPNLLDPEIVREVNDWVSLYREGALPREAATQGVQHVTDLYKRGRLAVINYGPNFLNAIRQESPRVFEATSVGPPVTGRLGRGHVAVMVVGVTTQSREPELAAALAWHLTGERSQEALCRIVPVLPSTRATLDSDLFLPPGPEVPEADAKLPRARALTAASLRRATAFTPALAVWPDLRRSFEDRIKRALLGGEAVEVSLRHIQNEWAGILRTASFAPADALPTIVRE